MAMSEIESYILYKGDDVVATFPNRRSLEDYALDKGYAYIENGKRYRWKDGCGFGFVYELTFKQETTQ